MTWEVHPITCVRCLTFRQGTFRQFWIVDTGVNCGRIKGVGLRFTHLAFGLVFNVCSFFAATYIFYTPAVHLCNKERYTCSRLPFHKDLVQKLFRELRKCGFSSDTWNYESYYRFITDCLILRWIKLITNVLVNGRKNRPNTYQRIIFLLWLIKMLSRANSWLFSYYVILSDGAKNAVSKNVWLYNYFCCSNILSGAVWNYFIRCVLCTHLF